jgi:hypothetical protein
MSPCSGTTSDSSLKRRSEHLVRVHHEQVDGIAAVDPSDIVSNDGLTLDIVGTQAEQGRAAGYREGANRGLASRGRLRDSQ